MNFSTLFKNECISIFCWSNDDGIRNIDRTLTETLVKEIGFKSFCFWEGQNLKWSGGATKTAEETEGFNGEHRLYLKTWWWMEDKWRAMGPGRNTQNPSWKGCKMFVFTFPAFGAFCALIPVICVIPATFATRILAGGQQFPWDNSQVVGLHLNHI